MKRVLHDARFTSVDPTLLRPGRKGPERGLLDPAPGLIERHLMTGAADGQHTRPS